MSEDGTKRVEIAGLHPKQSCKDVAGDWHDSGASGNASGTDKHPQPAV